MINHLATDAIVLSPPPGSINVRVGPAIEGPGGRWIPCATRVGRNTYYPGLFQVGPGQRQVCFADPGFDCAETALLSAVDLAQSAAA